MRPEFSLSGTPQYKHIERDAAAEIMSMIMAKRLREGASAEEKISLAAERCAMYEGDEAVVKKIMTVYAEEIRQTRNNGAS